MLNSINSENRIDFYKKIWQVASTYHHPLTLKALKRRASFLYTANKHRHQVDSFIRRVSAQGVPVTTEMLGMLEWPYLHNHWNISTKFEKVATHYEQIAKPFPALTRMHLAEPFEVISFEHISKGVKVAVDYTEWFVREGEVVLNIFRDDLRVASMAFILGVRDGVKVAYIGAVQGIHGGVSAEESLDIYKQLTKDFQGLRPRSLLLEVLKVVLSELGMEKLFGVSEQHRHHRHKYFHHDEHTVFKNDYNAFWEEHEGVLDQVSGFYEIPMTLSIKDMAEIPSKKRSMYKRRYEIIHSIKNNIRLKAA